MAMTAIACTVNLIRCMQLAFCSIYLLCTPALSPETDTQGSSEGSPEIPSRSTSPDSLLMAATFTCSPHHRERRPEQLQAGRL